MYKYSASTGGFYVPGIHSIIPDDAVDVSQNEHAALMAAQSAGEKIQPDSKGRPTAISPTTRLTDAQAGLRALINAGFDAALTASLTMPSRNTPASVVELALAIEDFKAEDPNGWIDLRAIHEARRDALLTAVDAASTPEAVQAIAVSYAV